MTERTISIRIAADGKAFVVESDAAAKASQRLDDQVTKTTADIQKLTTTVNAASADKFVRTMDQSVNAANKFTVSAAQTANAMRMLPAQITDVVTQLAGGQSPFLILVQQGGQVKDMFGGVGNTVRALGSLITPTRLAMGLFAGVLTAAALAYHQGSAESSAFNRAIVMSGNVAGVSAGQLGTMAKATSQLVGTQAQSAEALAALVATGKVQSDNLQRFAQVSVQAQRSIGQEIGDTVAAFAELGKSPVAASLKLNESLNYLTAATYKQIKTAEDLGDKDKAASLAQRAYADALASRSKDMEANLGTIERAWRSVKEVASSAWDAMLNVGRPESTQAQLDKVTEKLAGAQRAMKSQYATGNAFYSTEEGRKEVASLQLQQSLLQETVRLEQRAGEAKAAQVKLDQARLTVAQALEASASQQSKYADAIAKANRMADDAKSSPAERAALIAGVQRQYSELLNRGLDAQIEAWKGADKAILDDREQFFAALKVQEQLGQKNSLDIIGETADKSFEVYMARTAVLQRELDLVKRKKDSDKEQIALLNQLKEIQRDFDESQAKGNADYLVAMNKRKKAIQDVVAAQLEEDLAARAKAEADLLDKSNAITASVNDYVKGIEDANALLQLEVSLLGQSEVARNTAIAQYQEQLKLRKEELAIAQSGVQADQQDALLATVRTASARAQATAAGRIQLDAFKQTVDKIDDVFRQGFADLVNAGTTTWKAFTKSLATTFKTTVADAIYKSFAQPFVVKIIGSMLGLTGLSGLGGGAGGNDGNGILGMAQNANQLSNLWTKGSKFFDTASKWFSNLFGVSSGGLGSAAEGLAESFWSDFYGVGADSLMGSLGNSLGGTELGSLLGEQMGESFLSTAGESFLTDEMMASMGQTFSETFMSQVGSNLAVEAGTSVGASAAGGSAAAASGSMAVPIIGWIIAGMMAADGLFKAGYSEKTVDPLNANLAGIGSQMAMTTLLQKIGISDRWANVITGAPLGSWLMNTLGIAGGESRGGGQYGVSFDGQSVYNPRRDLTYTAENQNQGAAIAGKGVYYLEGPDGGEIAGDAVKTAIGKTVESINQTLKAVDSTATVSQFTAGLESSRKGRGGVFSGGKLSDGTSFGESGQGSNYDGNLFESTSTQDPSPYEALQNFSLDLQQVTLQALQAASDTPKSVKAALDAALQSVKGEDDKKAPTIEELDQDQLQKVMESLGSFIQTVADFRKALDLLPFDNLKKLSFDATTNLIGFAGGLDQLNASLSGYFTNFYSQAEQTKVKTDYVTNGLKDLGFAMPDLTQGSDKARTAFRALVESVDPSTEEGGKKFAALLNLQQAFADLTPIVEGTADAVRSAADILRERLGLENQLLELQGNTAEIRRRELEALDPSNRALQQQIWARQDQKTAAEEAAQALADATEAAKSASDAALSNVQRALDAQRDVVGSAITAAKEMLDQAGAVFDIARTNVRNLLATVDSASALSGAAGQKFVADALATALASGYLPDAQALGDAVDAARAGIDNGIYNSQFEEDRDRLVLASRLEGLQTLAGAQKTTAQLQLDAQNAQLKELDALGQSAQDALNELRGVKTGVMTVAEAIAALNATMQAEKKLTGSTASGSVGGGSGSAGAGAGGGAVFGGGGVPAAAAPAEPSKYTREMNIGNTGWFDRPVTDPAEIARLDRLAELGSAFTGTGDVAGYFNMAKANGYTLSDIQAATGYTYGDLVQATKNVGVPMFAAGGDHLGGLRWVGEQGPELEATGASRIWNQRQLGEALRAGSGMDADAVATEIRALREEQQAQAASIAALLNLVAKLLQQWDGEGMPTDRGVTA